MGNRGHWGEPITKNMVFCHRGLKLSLLQEVTSETVFSVGERGAFETSCPQFLSTIVSSVRKRGQVTVGPKTKRDCGTKRTNRHKPAQNVTIFVPAQILGWFDVRWRWHRR
jgi:hypothetical protein